MAEGVSWNQFKWSNVSTNTYRTWVKAFVIGLCVLSATIPFIRAATCPSSVPVSAAIISEECTNKLNFDVKIVYIIFIVILCSFTGFSNPYAFSVVAGQVSNSLYISYRLQSLSYFY